MQKTIQAVDVDQDRKGRSLPLITLRSWKRLGTARNAPRYFLPQSSHNKSFALASDAVGIDLEVLRIVLAKAHHPLLWNLVYPQVQSHDLMNTLVRRQSTLVLMKGAVNSISEAEVQTTRLSGESVQSIRIPTSANTLSRMLHTQDILATAVSPMSFGTETNCTLLSGAGLPWRKPSNQAKQEATCQSLTPAGHTTTKRLPDVKTTTSAPLDILGTVCDVAREVIGTVIDIDAPLMSVGLDSLSATDFTRTLSERLNIEIEATALFDYPTLESLADFLSSEFSNDVTEASLREEKQTVAEVPVLETRDMRTITIAAWNFSVAGGITTPSELRSLTMRALAVNTDVPLARWATPTPGAKPSAAYGSFMSADQLSFDHGAFGISLAEARSMDPQQNLVLSVGYSVLCQGSDFSSSRGSFTNSNTGVFVGVEPSGLEKKEANVFSASGGALSVTAGRLSFSLGLVGPCYSIDAACASSLAALHACVTTLQNGRECEDGVTIGTKVLSEAANYATSIGGMTSARGRCHTFDQRADGYCRGEGCGAFLLRSKASSGVEVLGSAVQQDGPSASLTAPNGSSQRRLIESVSRAITDKGSSSLEAHGTGTALGDPIEVRY